MHRRELANHWLRAGGILALVVGLLASLHGSVGAQGNSQTFAATGKTVQGVFLAYWNEHGGLAQQGYPISDEMNEVSPTDGKTYKVQYFERAVFEQHPEQAGTQFEVLLSLLGSFQYKQQYPGGAPNQQASADNPRLFAETGKTSGGKFRAYWEAHGGLAQQGYPISDEFQEKNNQNGQTYTVQYFQRAVFELHPENAGTDFEVLLSQLGKAQYRLKYLASTATPVPPTAISTVTPTATPAGSAGAPDCSGIPDNQGVDVEPRCAPLYTTFSITGRGFTEDDHVGLWATMPNGKIFAAKIHIPVDQFGTTHPGLFLYLDDETPYYGLWVMTMEGIYTHRKAYGYFKVYDGGAPTPKPRRRP